MTNEIIDQINCTISDAETEIQSIDSDRPNLLARLITEGGDFTLDANQQRRRRELALLIERHRLAAPVLQGMAVQAQH